MTVLSVHVETNSAFPPPRCPSGDGVTSQVLVQRRRRYKLWAEFWVNVEAITSHALWNMFKLQVGEVLMVRRDGILEEKPGQAVSAKLKP